MTTWKKPLGEYETSFTQFRSNALSSLSMLKNKPKFKSANDKEAYIRSEWERHNRKQFYNACTPSAKVALGKLLGVTKLKKNGYE